VALATEPKGFMTKTAMSNPNESLETQFRQDLDQVECADPLCQNDHPVYVQASCHIGAGLAVAYDKHVGCIYLHCSVCQLLIMRVQVQKATIQ
jgi:hypothetical protein